MIKSAVPEKTQLQLLLCLEDSHNTIPRNITIRSKNNQIEKESIIKEN